MITYTIETWNYDDKRLPLSVQKEPPSAEFLASIKEVQLQPIGMGHNKADGWFLIFGRKRLLACRLNQQPINVQIFKGVKKSDVAKLSFLENSHRSKNEVTDFMAIKDLLSRPGATYENIAKYLNISVSSVKAIEKKYHKVPAWVFTGIFSGDISISTAKKIGSAKATIQKKLEKMFAKEGKITFNTVKHANDVELKDLMPQLIKEPPRVVAISELDKVAALIYAKQYEESLAYIESLKKGE